MEKVPKAFMTFEELTTFSYGIDITESISTENVIEMLELEVSIENALKTFEEFFSCLF